jgi:hypothetical protein
VIEVKQTKRFNIRWKWFFTNNTERREIMLDFNPVILVVLIPLFFLMVHMGRAIRKDGNWRGIFYPSAGLKAD